jgi:endonuclease/exonuclease/phosphatase family metal-dependent hydrolase
MRIATFNLQNLRLRRREGGARLDGARDGDVAEDRGPRAEALDAADRRLTAAVLAQADADVVALQEVFDQATLDHFHDAWLAPTGVRTWPHRICLPGNDGRGLDVAVMSRSRPARVTSHAAETPATLGLGPIPETGPQERVFRRDCLEVEVDALALFVCHLKAPYPDREAAWRVRRLEAEAVRRLVERRFPTPHDALWLVLGDLNEPPYPPPGRERSIAPLIDGFTVDLLERLPPDERWSYRSPDGAYGRPDALLASPGLARRWPDATPRVLRAGMGLEARRDEDPRLPGVGWRRPHASDHAALVLDLPGL